MERLALFLILLSTVGCASIPPRNKNNACLLLTEKDEWISPLKESSDRWGIPVSTILSIIYHESKFVSNAKPPRKSFLGIKFIGRRISSAYGYSQALDGTWDEYQRKTGRWYARRTNFSDSVDFIGWYLHRSVNELKISPENAYHLYLAYHQGNAGFRRKSYLKKPRIRNYARKVQRTALVYEGQMRSCS